MVLKRASKLKSTVHPIAIEVSNFKHLDLHIVKTWSCPRSPNKAIVPTCVLTDPTKNKSVTFSFSRMADESQICSVKESREETFSHFTTTAHMQDEIKLGGGSIHWLVRK